MASARTTRETFNTQLNNVFAYLNSASRVLGRAVETSGQASSPTIREAVYLATKVLNAELDGLKDRIQQLKVHLDTGSNLPDGDPAAAHNALVRDALATCNLLDLKLSGVLQHFTDTTPQLPIGGEANVSWARISQLPKVKVELEKHLVPEYDQGQEDHLASLIPQRPSRERYEIAKQLVAHMAKKPGVVS